VVAGIGFTNFELWGAAASGPQNFYMFGSMGLAFPIAWAWRWLAGGKVFGLEGDGSLLMQVGTLGTIAGLAQTNLAMIVWDNGAYQITGGQPTTTATVVDLVGLARASGIDKAYWAGDERHFEELVDRALDEDGPFFIAAKIDSARPAAKPSRSRAVTGAFMRGLGVRKDPFSSRREECGEVVPPRRPA
jgi:thiamine pyrophosphate-dependent acetolactate synthase large subunit-like protein